jgi:hypothetical protein
MTKKNDQTRLMAALRGYFGLGYDDPERVAERERREIERGKPTTTLGEHVREHGTGRFRRRRI